MYDEFKIKDYSTMSKENFIVSHLFYGGLASFDLFWILPLLVPDGMEYNHSVVRLILCMLIINIFGITMNYVCNRRVLGVAADIVIGLNTYMIITFWKYLAKIFILFFGVAFIPVVLDGLRIIKNKKSNNKYYKTQTSHINFSYAP